MQDVFHIKQGATGPAIVRNLRDDAGNPLPLGGAAVSFWMGQPGGEVIVAGAPCTIVSAAGGQVRYDWQPGDTDTFGRWSAEFRVRYLDETTEIVPSPDYLEVRIAQRIGGAWAAPDPLAPVDAVAAMLVPVSVLAQAATGAALPPPLPGVAAGIVPVTMTAQASVVTRPVLSDLSLSAGSDPVLAMDSTQAGTLFWMTSAEAVRTAAQIVAGTGAEASGSFVVADSGTTEQAINVTGTAADTARFVHVVLSTTGNGLSLPLAEPFTLTLASWQVAGGVGQIVISGQPALAAPAVPNAAGGVGQIVISEGV